MPAPWSGLDEFAGAASALHPLISLRNPWKATSRASPSARIGQAERQCRSPKMSAITPALLISDGLSA